RQLLVEQANATQGLLFVEIPLINAFPFDWTEIWLVKASQQDQIARVTLRDGVSCQNVSQIIGSQVQTEQATRVIVNDGTLDELRQKVALALQQSNLA
ncbi:MAG: dephospho-CoA kinase, partial [Clostridia bacterium]|nr:dephospho-CoA kinase [Clostridia bacterium]